MTNTDKDSTFGIAYGVLSNEKQVAYDWASQWIVDRVSCLDDWKTRDAIGVVLTDCEPALMNALKITLPRARNLVCIWHINKRIKEKINGLITRWVPLSAQAAERDVKQTEIIEAVTRVYDQWNRVVGAQTPAQYDEMIDTLRSMSPPDFANYVDTQWDPYQEQFVACWTDTSLHLGMYSSC